MPRIGEIAYRQRKRTPTERELSTPTLDEHLLAQQHTIDKPALVAFLVLLKIQLYFLLQLGYFKAKQLFFTFTFDDVVEDVTYLPA